MLSIVGSCGAVPVVFAVMAIEAADGTAAPAAAGAIGLAFVGFAVSAWWAVRASDGPAVVTLATHVTAVRAGAIVALAGYVMVSPASGVAAWVPPALFGAGAGLDWVDGKLARWRDAATALGARLDAEVDGLALLIGSLVAIRFGTAPLAFLAVGLARYAFVGGIAARRYRGKQVEPLPERQSRRLLGALGMATVAVLLTPVVDSGVSRPLSLAVAVAVLAGFARDWLLVTGWRSE